MSTARQELPSSPPQMAATVETPSSTLKIRVFLAQFFTFSVTLFIVALMALTAGVTYVKTAKVQKCHADRVLGFIPAGRTCTIENRF